MAAPVHGRSPMLVTETRKTLLPGKVVLQLVTLNCTSHPQRVRVAGMETPPSIAQLMNYCLGFWE
ncbi:hypothetical protein E2C01_054625 [Portunus trituberculatus]|uniref:Uncharacterized protein n=1 Tax=Portunus trituberculatus TaxID=210409 RepID=A0A5B7GSK2_PORTR|nr:hypothetical protein [Portunus trituberculatus]